VSRYDWLLFLHVTAAFLFLSGAVAIAVLQLAALRGSRPSEIAFLLGLTRIPEVAIGVGSLGTLGFGIWLAHDVGYGFGEGWIVGALVLWALSGALGARGGARTGAPGSRRSGSPRARIGSRPSSARCSRTGSRSP
jgi:uncharacterized membrane protein